MPAFVQQYRGRLAVVFERDGDKRDTRIAESGSAAVLLAMRILSIQDVLLPGDKLTVENASEGRGD
jgi:hypothetical protein